MALEAEEVDTKVAEALTEPVSQRDDVDSDVRAAIASLKDEPPVAEAAPEPESPKEIKGDHPSDPLRYADGTFKPTKDAAPVTAAAPDPKSPPVDNTAKASAPQLSTAASAPPVSWAAEAKQAWASLPPAIQAAVIKREDEVSAGFRQKSEDVRRYEGLLSPVAQEAASLGLDVEKGINALLNTHRALRSNPAETLATLAQHYGVNLKELPDNPPASQQQVRSDPVFAQVTQTVSSLEERLNGLMLQQNMGVVESFAGKAPHYQDVEDQLPALMQELRAGNPSLQGLPLLQQAYDRAIWLNPDVRAKIIAEQQAETAKTQVAQVQQKAAQASKAAVSVKGSTADVRPPKKTPALGNDVYADVRASIEQLRAG